MFDFIAATGMTLLWDMNGLKTRDGSGPWNPAVNATAMLTYLNSKYGGKVDYAFSLGNEPGHWPVKVRSLERCCWCGNRYWKNWLGLMRCCFTSRCRLSSWPKTR